LHLIGTLGPLTAAYLVTAWTERRQGVSELIRRAFEWRVGWWWLTLMLGESNTDVPARGAPGFLWVASATREPTATVNGAKNERQRF
jgi:hypothetical protein